MPKCGSQIMVCDMPVRFDTYEGCTHACAYCFVKLKKDISQVTKGEGVKSLENFIKGHRGKDVSWCDWSIPIHWGGVSDPFQPAERIQKYSLQALELFAKTKYPFAVSTKGGLIAEEPYLSLLSQCNAVVQVSLVSPLFDSIETGAPPYEERMNIIVKVAPKVKRFIVRVQPFVMEAKPDILKAIKRYKEMGVYGITVEGMKYKRKKQGLIKLGGDFVYPVKTLKRAFEEIKAVCHKYGLVFYSAENRLRNMGDSLSCCGTDGLKGFKSNSYNVTHFIYDKKNFKPTKAMTEKGSAMCVRALSQNTASYNVIKDKSLYDMMETAVKDKGIVSQLLPIDK